MTGISKDGALKLMRRALRDGLESKSNITVLGQTFLYCDKGDTIEFKADLVSDFEAEAMESGVYLMAKSYSGGTNSEQTGIHPMIYMSSDDFVNHVLNTYIDKGLKANEIADLSADLRLQYFNINTHKTTENNHSGLEI